MNALPRWVPWGIAVCTGVALLAAALAVTTPGVDPGDRAGEEIDLDAFPKFDRWEAIEDFPVEMALYETVFWEPDDTLSLRELIRTTPFVKDRDILEIGTGSGLVALCCLRAGARHVVATDVNAHALANARYNAERMQVSERLETRLVPVDDAGAFSVIAPGETFDLIISNPPWEDGIPARIDQYALYDPRFSLLDSLLTSLRDHLRPGGKLYLAYGAVTGIRLAIRRAEELGYRTRILDDRDLNTLPEVFLPGMLIEIAPEAE